VHKNPKPKALENYRPLKGKNTVSISYLNLNVISQIQNSEKIVDFEIFYLGIFT
jgi:hypothetical protein|tara:strand:- start:6371 stop:6532 length:162 start_codon:yes stop_codon:yes gene_type:complete